MRAIILAAGIASRFQSTLKPFLEINGEPIIARMVRQLKKAGVGPIYVVIGYQAEKFLELRGVSLIHNIDYSKADNALSMKVALDTIGFEDTLMLDGDLVLSDEALTPILDSYKQERDSMSLVDFELNDPEAMKVVLENNRIVEYSKEKGVGADICELVTKEVLQNLYVDLDHVRWWGVGVGENKINAKAVAMSKGTKWIEIDTPEDYEKAKLMFKV